MCSSFRRLLGRWASGLTGATLLCGLSGCAERQAPVVPSPAGVPSEQSRAALTPGSPPAPPSETNPGNRVSNLPPPVARTAEIVLDPKQPLRSLPELRVENIGLHIGGGPNDAETKAPFLNAIAERFPAFMDCYRKNEDPAPGGRFGIDLHIARSGGHPRLEQPRTALRGAEFRACLVRVFESVEFQKPKRGPTTISYSLRFKWLDAP